ncbi:unnamed protein product [Cyprideis torosa]|uniref:Uncharacterized protein n=1 Tax=Cyprideis torosa TaxID=163714 RepID=A0A7R8WK68_9CRUS|nr:unnamed protein product [Cyprideis torosa]CAG0900103.1 unnamed protein product [Cyprideis torosa]
MVPITSFWRKATYNFNIDPKSVTISGFSSGGAFAHQFHVIHSSLVNGVGVFGGATYNFNIDPKSVTISGFSSGGAFAHQFHVIHSSLVNGVGVFGGAPYRCFAGSIWVSLCRLLPFLTAVERVQRQAVRDAEMGRIDDLRGLADDKVFIFHGKKDLVIRPGNGRNVEKFYNTFTADRSNIKAVYDDKAAHVFPTKYRGNADCGMLFFPGLFLGEAFVRGCDYDAVYEMFRHFYGPPAMVHRRDANRGKLIKFDQKSLFPKYSSMDKTGFAYIPSRCAFGFQCKLHIALHGCFGGRAFEDTIFPTRTEFARWANEFGVIVIFPQVAPHLIPPNLFGCWDVSGYTGIREYATRHAKQEKGAAEVPVYHPRYGLSVEESRCHSVPLSLDSIGMDGWLQMRGDLQSQRQSFIMPVDSHATYGLMSGTLWSS